MATPSAEDAMHEALILAAQAIKDQADRDRAAMERRTAAADAAAVIAAHLNGGATAATTVVSAAGAGASTQPPAGFVQAVDSQGNLVMVEAGKVSPNGPYFPYNDVTKQVTTAAGAVDLSTLQTPSDPQSTLNRRRRALKLAAKVLG